MPCYSPLVGYRHIDGGPLTFGKEQKNARTVTVPCGQCRGCRLEKSRQWALRCLHESQLHERNCFVTLTYDNENLPEHGSLFKPDLQRFFKRLRHHRGTFRYYACGEYGDTTQRAHYHACIFGLDFNDKLVLEKHPTHTLYYSAELAEIWGKGNASIGDLNFETAAYTARYIMKKQTGLAKGGRGYVRIDEQTGEIRQLVQPFAVMSLRPAIASRWLHKYHADLYGADKDYIMVRGKKMRPAKYYDKLYDQINPEHMAMIKKQRYDNNDGLTTVELDTRARIAHARENQYRKDKV